MRPGRCSSSRVLRAQRRAGPCGLSPIVAGRAAARRRGGQARLLRLHRQRRPPADDSSRRSALPQGVGPAGGARDPGCGRGCWTSGALAGDVPHPRIRLHAHARRNGRRCACWCGSAGLRHTDALALRQGSTTSRPPRWRWAPACIGIRRGALAVLRGSAAHGAALPRGPVDVGARAVTVLSTKCRTFFGLRRTDVHVMLDDDAPTKLSANPTFERYASNVAHCSPVSPRPPR